MTVTCKLAKSLAPTRLLGECNGGYRDLKQVYPLWKTIWMLLKKLKIELQKGPTIFLLGIYQKEMRIPLGKNSCTLMFTATIFTIAKIQKQPKYPTIHEWVKEM
jgi:hypothetical protein